MGTKKTRAKDPAAVALAAKRMTRMTARRRREVAMLGVAARQAKRRAAATQRGTTV